MQQNLYTGEQWQLTEDHIQALAELEVPAPQDPQQFQVWLQTGDETLDYRAPRSFTGPVPCVFRRVATTAFRVLPSACLRC